MFIDKEDIRKNAEELIKDVNQKEITSPVWAWVGVGAALGFIASCIKCSKPVRKPILGRWKNTRRDNGKPIS